MEQSRHATSRRLRFQGWFALGVLTAVILVTFMLLAWRDLQNRYAQVARQGHDTTWFIGRNVAEKFRQYDRELTALVAEIETSDGAGFTSEEVWRRMVRATQTIPYVRSVGLYDASGAVVQHSERRGGFPDLSVADRGYFNALKADPERGSIITAPFLSKVYGETIIGIARAIHGSEGGFAGVALIGVSPESLDLLGGLPNLPAGSAIAVHRRDGINLFRAPLIPEKLGSDLSKTVIFTQGLPVASVGVVYTPPGGSTIDGADRLLAYRALDEWPLVMVVGVLRSEVVAGWRREWMRNAVLVGMALVGFSWLAVIAQRQITGRLEAELSLSRQELEHRLKVEAELRRWATTDSLTGMANRRHFLEQCEREMQRALRHSRPMGMLIFDVDLFKSINDRFGHATGDESLKTIARLAGGTLRETDVMGRLGGEEFGVLVPETDLEGAADLAERLRVAVAAANVVVRGERVAIAVSIGVAAMMAEDDSIDTLMARADEALYRAKNGGRNRVEVALPPFAARVAG